MLLRLLHGNFPAMIGDIRKLIAARPFVPFTIHTADGGQLRVPTVDPVALLPAAGRVFVHSGQDSYEILSPLLITRTSVDADTALSS